MTRYWIGTSGYNYAEWRGPFYPPELPEQGLLGFYAKHFSSVELNYTFHRMPTARVLQSWAKEAPEPFAFSLKAPRRITHDLRLRDASEPLGLFCDVTKVIKGRLGAMLFQLPPFLKKDVSRLEDFLHQLPPSYRAAFEFRSPSWFADDVFECMRRFDAALCIGEQDEAAAPFEVTAPFGYFRLRKSEYSDADLEALVTRLRGVEGQWRDVFLYFKHEAGGQGAQLATRLRALLDPLPVAVADATSPA